MTEQERTQPTGAVPGFTAEQSWVLDVVAERAAQRAVEKLRLGDCPVACAKMEALDKFCFGRAEDGIAGVDNRLPAAEAAVERLTDSFVWLQRALIAALVAGAAGFGVWLLEHHAG